MRKTILPYSAKKAEVLKEKEIEIKEEGGKIKIITENITPFDIISILAETGIVKIIR